MANDVRDDVTGIVGAYFGATRPQPSKIHVDMSLGRDCKNSLHVIDDAVVPAIGIGSVVKIPQVIGAGVRIVDDIAPRPEPLFCPMGVDAGQPQDRAR
jgi:hypothetical protein